jgi:hypothetical protein
VRVLRRLLRRVQFRVRAARQTHVSDVGVARLRAEMYVAHHLRRFRDHLAKCTFSIAQSVNEGDVAHVRYARRPPQHDTYPPSCATIIARREQPPSCRSRNPCSTRFHAPQTFSDFLLQRHATSSQHLHDGDTRSMRSYVLPCFACSIRQPSLPILLTSHPPPRMHARTVRSRTSHRR